MRKALVALVASSALAVAIPGTAKEPQGDADVTTQQNGQPGITAIAEYEGPEAAGAGVSPEGTGSSGNTETSGVTAAEISSGIAVSIAEVNAPVTELPLAPVGSGVDPAEEFAPLPVIGDGCFVPSLPECVPPPAAPPNANPNPPGDGPKPPAPPPPPSPEELAQVAIDQAVAAAAIPELRLAPSAVGLTGLDSFVWLADRPQPIEAVASVPGLTVIAQARPVQYVWDFGDGATAVTSHPGRPWTPQQPGDIAHLYEVRGTYSVGVEVIWSARWQVAGGPWTDLGFFSTSDSKPYAVRQIVTRLVPGRYAW
ncbi:MAG: PKD domain-containing protein [Actinomycetota bacterium]|nr:PKD domain-containing protein [Actinomycetota bacterium]